MITSELTIKDIGPIHSLSLSLRPGINVLRGRNGKGKTTALETADALVSGRTHGLTVRQGALQGEAEGFGVAIRIGRKTTRAGEVEVVSLDGKLSVAELVDPGLKDEGAADARRIKALVALAKVRPSIDLFRGLLDGREFDQAIPSTVADAPDLLTMADRFKRAAEAAARSAESQMETAKGKCQSAEEAAKGVDLTAESDAATLQQQMVRAVQHESMLRERAKAATEAQAKADASMERIAAAERSYTGPTIDEAKDAEAKARESLDAATHELREAQARLEAAQRKQEEASRGVADAIKARKLAEQHEATIVGCKAELAKSVPAAPSEAELCAARDAVQRANEAVERGVMVRRAHEQMMRAETYRKEYHSLAAKAKLLRDAAAGVDGVLSEIVGRTTSVLRVVKDRLVLDTARGETYFSDLSHGERWRIALDIAIAQLEAIPVKDGELRILVIPQEAWEAEDPINRDAIHAQAAERGVAILTGEASADEEITAEAYEPAGA